MPASRVLVQFPDRMAGPEVERVAATGTDGAFRALAVHLQVLLTAGEIR